MLRPLAAFLLPLLLATALADTVVLKDGSLLEGTVVAQNEKFLRLKTDKDEFFLWKDELKDKTAWDAAIAEYRGKAAAAKSADEHRALAAWCKEKGLSEEARFHFEEVLRLSPADDAAAAELKLEKGKDGNYATERSVKEKQGFVRYLGEWIKTEDRDKFEKGTARVGKSWKSKADYTKAVQAEVARQATAREAREAEEAQKKWADKTAAEDKAIKAALGGAYRAEYVDGYIVRTDVPAADCKAFYRQITAFRKQFVRDFGRDMGLRFDAPINVFLFSSRDAYLAGIEKLDPSSANLASRVSGFADTNRGSAEESRIYLFKNDNEKPDPRSTLVWINYIGTFMHECFHVFLSATTRDRQDNTIGIGLNEGFASFLEGTVFNDKAGTLDWGRKNALRLANGRDGRKAIDLEQLIRMPSKDFNSVPAMTSTALYGVAESFVNFVMYDQKGKYRAGFLKFIASYAQGGPGDPEKDRIKRLEKFLGAPLSQLQKECDAYTATRKE